MDYFIQSDEFVGDFYETTLALIIQSFSELEQEKEFSNLQEEEKEEESI